MREAIAKAASLPCWSAPVDPEPLGGGLTNTNFTVTDGAKKYVVRVGGDIPVHQILRFHEHAASIAASRAGISPAVFFLEPGILVLEFVEGRTLEAHDIRQPETLIRVLDLIKRCHRQMLKEFRGPALIFWVFHVIRDYAHTLRSSGSAHAGKLERFLTIAQHLEQMIGPVEIVFAHNDLLHGNFIDDGKRLWLIDWDYAGFNTPLFDLANLAGNNALEAEQERGLLEAYFEAPVSTTLWRAFCAMKCASFLRETMWSMVSEIHSDIDFDYAAYTAENLQKFEHIYGEFCSLPGGMNG